MSVELKLSRANRIYLPSEALEGKIIMKLTSSISHYGIRLTANGSVNLKVPAGSAGVIETLYGGVKPIGIVSKIIEVGPSGRIASGTTEVPFSIILKLPGENNWEKFYETFHGANISIQYLVSVDIARGYLHKSLSATVEFIIESDQADCCRAPVSPEMFVFYITQDTQKHPLLPELASGGFRVVGKMSTHCSLSDPISGELMVETSGVPIRSIDIHLLRVESILVGEKIITETSLIQTTQIADGDVCYNMALPIYVILPRLLTCPTVFAGPFSIEFKVTIVISFESELSKLHSKSNPRTPRLWVSIISNIEAISKDSVDVQRRFFLDCRQQWKLYRLNWSEQDEVKHSCPAADGNDNPTAYWSETEKEDQQLRRRLVNRQIQQEMK